MLFLMACHDVSIGNPCDAEFVLSEPSLYTYSLIQIWNSRVFPYYFVSSSELYIYGRLTSVNYVIKKCNTKWRKLKALLGVIFSPLTCAVKSFCKFLFGFLWRKVFRNGFFPF